MKKVFNKTLFSIAGAFACISAFISCSNEDFYDKEFYHPVIYLLSSGSQNVYTAVYPFKEKDAIRYFSIGSGGSRPLPQQVQVELEADTILLKNYNRLNFIVDTPSFAKLLPSNRFNVGSYSLTMPANSGEQYVKVPIKVNQEGLSPDSIYFVPISIKSVSNYEVNPEKKNVLFRVVVENDYAQQIVSTMYYQRGSMISGTTVTSVNGSKMVQPLSVDEVRMFTGTRVQTNKSPLTEIKNYSVVVRINADQTTSVRSFNPQLIEVEQLALTNYNRYYKLKNQEGKDVQYMDLCYRYRTRTSPSSTFGTWTEMRESLQRTN